MKETKDIFIDNVKDAIKAFNDFFKVLIAVIIIFFLILLKDGINAPGNGNMIIPFLNLDAPVVIVALICLCIYTITGILLLHAYNSINKNMNKLDKESYDAMRCHPAWIISGSTALKIIIITAAIIINAAVLVNLWPNKNWTTTIYTPALLSIPLFILLVKIIRKK